eukprot:CAMPEP_0181474564 /NCGR_PEP_ID=MMETSP1110-20121109/40725_1 /TAXON_ID=174948 /ORGANISM="Symbiodinium sp., Strain CCMP421" /LENGTH=181 /DNA_ID=CAMNT_0023599757 /DNA_START=514 /DNA_END=1059 /DNA_ORIENTATION=+
MSLTFAAVCSSSLKQALSSSSELHDSRACGSSMTRSAASAAPPSLSSTSGRAVSSSWVMLLAEASQPHVGGAATRALRRDHPICKAQASTHETTVLSAAFAISIARPARSAGIATGVRDEQTGGLVVGTSPLPPSSACIIDGRGPGCSACPVESPRYRKRTAKQVEHEGLDPLIWDIASSP